MITNETQWYLNTMWMNIKRSIQLNSMLRIHICGTLKWRIQRSFCFLSILSHLIHYLIRPICMLTVWVCTHMHKLCMYVCKCFLSFYFLVFSYSHTFGGFINCIHHYFPNLTKYGYMWTNWLSLTHNTKLWLRTVCGSQGDPRRKMILLIP